ncbi:glycosyltransferase family A protein [Telmatospirillum sp.]|uniref:glycosyltransferase family 2 protein n=1 Tax=Telmatospirillum sp. TaxID=2079197 RepID=UPI002842E011|nr:glycosyltransferase family A protein [Telmatospirillum sp.]MDR3440698.1 glycosyltransferase family A protein [Telmatospirillum sp.]
MTPIVSVVIPVYNRADLVGTAVQSVLDQKGIPLEILLVDDASTDDLASTVARFPGAPLTVLRHAINGGAAVSRNTGIAAATGEWIAFLDSDDIWLPGKLEQQLTFLQDRHLVGGCTDYYIRRAVDKDEVEERHLAYCEELSLGDLVWGCYVSPGATLMVRREVWKEIGPLDPDYRRFEDWDWLMRFSRHHHLGMLAQPLSCVRFSAPAARQQVVEGLIRLQIHHGALLAKENPELARRFRAGIAMERAAMAFRDHRPLIAAWHVLCSLALVPVSNLAFAKVVAPRVRGATYGAKPRVILPGSSG